MTAKYLFINTLIIKKTNLKKFKYSPKNDVQINDKHFNSGLKITDQYVYRDQVEEGNTATNAGSSSSYNRKWDKQNNVNVITHWEQSTTTAVSINGDPNDPDHKPAASNKFDIIIEYGYDPADLT